MISLRGFASASAAFCGGVGVACWISQRWLRPKWERSAIVDWYPPAGFGDNLLISEEEAQRLRQRREAHDAGRSHLPRADAGRPARVHRPRARVKRSNAVRANVKLPR